MSRWLHFARYLEKVEKTVSDCSWNKWFFRCMGSPLVVKFSQGCWPVHTDGTLIIKNQNCPHALVIPTSICGGKCCILSICALISGHSSIESWVTLPFSYQAPYFNYSRGETQLQMKLRKNIFTSLETTGRRDKRDIKVRRLFSSAIG